MPPSNSVQCPRCRTRFDDRAWDALDLSERIEAAEVGRFMRKWSGDECIEVRTCGFCKAPIPARRVRALQ